MTVEGIHTPRPSIRFQDPPDLEQRNKNPNKLIDQCNMKFWLDHVLATLITKHCQMNTFLYSALFELVQFQENVYNYPAET